MKHIEMDHSYWLEVSEEEIERAFQDMHDEFYLVPNTDLASFLEANLDIIADAHNVGGGTSALAYQSYIIEKCLNLHRNIDYDCSVTFFTNAEREIWYRLWERVWHPYGAMQFNEIGHTIDPWRKEMCLNCNCRRFQWSYKEQIELFEAGSIEEDPRLWTNSVCPKLARALTIEEMA